MIDTVIDVSHLPPDVMDHRSPIWWGNTLLLFIESTMFALLFASYFYLKQNFETWPPPRVNQVPVLYQSAPSVAQATIILGVLLVSIVPMLWCSRACLRHDVGSVKAGLLIADAMGLAAIALEFSNLRSVYFRWDDNAYASVVWALLGLHLFHAIVATSENGLMTIWVFAKGLDDKHARDIRVSSVYWYWVAAVWTLVYAVVYWAPRLL